MRNNFLNLVAKMPQNTGGGTSRTKNRSVTVSLSSDTTTNREMTERRPREDRETFVLRSSLLGTLKYVACLLLALVLGVGQMWADCEKGTLIFSMEVTSAPSNKIQIAAKSGSTNGSLDLVANENVTVVGTSAVMYNSNSSAYDAITTAGEICFKNQTKHWIEISFPCALQAGDKISFTTSKTNPIAFSGTASGTKYSTTDNKLEISTSGTSELIGKTSLWIWRPGNEPNVKSLRIIRPLTITLDATTNGGTVSVTSIEGAIGDKVVLPHAFKSGNIFSGWFGNATGGSPKDNYYAINSDETVYAQFAAIPESGDLFSLEMLDALKPAKEVSLDKGYQVDLLQYAAVSGGAAFACNTTSSSNHMKITTAGKLSFTGTAAYLKIDLDFALAEGDEIATDASAKLWVSASATTSAPSSGPFVDGSNQTYVVGASDGLKNNSTIYIWRSSNATLTTITITRPAPAATHTLAWDFAGGSCSATEGDDYTAGGAVAEGATLTYPAANTMSKTDYLFDGWSSSATTMPTTDLTITAQWATAYTVTFASNGGGGTMDPIQYKADAEVTIPACDFTPEDAYYAFTHWAITGVPGKTTGNPGETFDMPAGPVTLTAQWAASYGITKGSHTNGDFTIDPTSAAAGTEITLAATPDEDYLFDAWEVVKTSDGTDAGVTVTNNKFEMPAFAVTVNATFVADTRKKVLMLVDKLSGGNWKGTGTDKLYAALSGDYHVYVEAAGSQTLTDYDLVVLHESIGGTSTADAVVGSKTTTVPVLNTKTYFYGNTNDASQRWQWGAPNAGQTVKGATLNSAYCNVANHPIFAGVNDAGFVEIIDDAAAKAMQPIGAFAAGKEGYTLATTPNAETPGGIGTAIQEIPSGDFRGTGKYLLISVSNNSLANLNANGQKLFQNAAAYLLSDASWTPVLAPATEGIVASPAASYSEGDNISLSITATNVDAATTYTWYKGTTLAAAEEAGAIQAAKTIAESGNVYAKPSCLAEDAGTYWCVITKSAGCELSASLDVTVLTCTKPGTPANLTATDIAYTTATLGWDAAENANGYKISIVKKSDASVVLDWTDCATNSYAATDLTQGTEYTFKVKAVGATGYCEYGLEASKDFTTTAPSVADLVTIADDWTFTPSATITAGTLAEDNKLFATGGDCDISSSKMRVKENRALTFKLNSGAKVKVTFTEKSDDSTPREMQLGTINTGAENKAYGHSGTSPAVFDVTADGVVYLTASKDLYFSKLEIMYPHSVTYNLNGGTGTLPTQEAKYVGETFTAHDGTTDITAPTGKEFSKWVDQDEADVLGGATYTMPAKAVTLTAQWIDPPTRYTVSFDLQGHGSAITSQSVADGEKALKPADPSESGWDFEGWYTDAACTAGNEFDFNTAIIADRPLFAKWTEFDACAVLTPATSGETIGVGDAISLQTGSVGGTMEAVVKSGETTTNLVYTENGLAFNSSGDRARVKVTLGHKLQKGSIIRVTLKANGDNTRDRGLDIYNETGTKKGFLGFAKEGYENGDVAKFSYVVTDDDGLKNTKIFYLYRNNSVWMADLKVANCAPQDFTVTYKDGETILGTEDVFENGHPTAAGVNTRKSGYVFDGWAETDGGAVVDLSTITITDAKTLYAKYTARDCSGIGSKFKFVVATGKSNGNMMASAPSSMALTTENYLSELAGGELVASIEGTSNNRITYSDNKGISFPNGDGGKLTIKLDCPLQENDEIRFINYASNGNGLTLSDGTNNIVLPSNNASTVQTITVPAAWETTASYELTLVRVSGKTPKISYFEIYRRPALTGVSLADLTVREGASATPIMTLSPSADALVTNQAWSIISGDEKISINPTTGEVTGVAQGDAEIKVVLNENPAISATATVHVVESFVQQDVDESVVWDFSKAGEVSNSFTEQILANVDGVTLDATQFNARQLVGTAQNITTTYFQGTMLTFNATKAGLLYVRFTNGNGNVRTLKVYAGDPEVEIASWSYSNAATEYKSVEVPAGKVTLRSFQGDAPNNVRVMKMEFFAENTERARTLAVGNLGTTCIENECIVRGAEIYAIKGKNEIGKIVFEELDADDVLEAGHPYVMVAKEANIRFFNTIEEPATEPYDASNGLIGTFEQKVFAAGEASNGLYFFKDHALWAAKETGMTIPAYRCYLKMDEVGTASPNPAPGRRRIVLGVQGEQVATGIDELNASETPVKVMIDGQLFIIRGEKMYNANGQLVK